MKSRQLPSRSIFVAITLLLLAVGVVAVMRVVLSPQPEILIDSDYVVAMEFSPDARYLAVIETEDKLRFRCRVFEIKTRKVVLEEAGACASTWNRSGSTLAIASLGKHAVIKLETTKWQSRGQAELYFTNCGGLCFDRHENLYVCHYLAQDFEQLSFPVLKWDTDQDQFKPFGPCQDGNARQVSVSQRGGQARDTVAIQYHPSECGIELGDTAAVLWKHLESRGDFSWVKVSPAGEHVAVLDDANLTIYASEDWRVERRWTLKTDISRELIGKIGLTPVAFSDDGTRCAVNANGTVNLYNLQTGKRVGTWNSSSRSVALSSDGGRIAISTSRRQIGIFKTLD